MIPNLTQPRCSALCFGLLALLLCLSTTRAEASFLERWLAPDKELWQRWTAHDPTAETRISHTAWTEFLDRYLVVVPDGPNRLRYGAVSSDDHQRLKAYITSLAQTPIRRFNRDQQFAYWVNLYNALTVDLVLDAYPVDSIRDISGGVFSAGPWDQELVTIEGVALSLNDIEHRILRPIWDDPRIHYAVNCASIGCPDLQPQAFTAETTEPLLNLAARTYINAARGVWFESERLYASSIYNWFREDFGGSEAGILRHLRRYADQDLAARLQRVEAIAGYDYDWSLNNATSSHGDNHD